MRTLVFLFAVATLCSLCIKACGDANLDPNAVAVGMMWGAAGALAARR